MKATANAPALPPECEPDLHRMMGSLALDPLGFVRAAYPWGMAGTDLEAYRGPDAWQADVLTEMEAMLVSVLNRAFGTRP